MIHVIATIEVHPDRREDFLREFRQLVPSVRGEEGCLAYGPAIDAATGIAAQPPAREHVVVVVEQWASLAALNKHLVAPHMRQYRARVKDLVAKVELRVLEPVQAMAGRERRLWRRGPPSVVLSLPALPPRTRCRAAEPRFQMARGGITQLGIAQGGLVLRGQSADDPSLPLGGGLIAAALSQ